MIGKHHNYQFDAVSPGGVPEASGDRYFAQDLFRDVLYTWDKIGLILKDLISQVPILLSGGVVTQGAGATLNITSGNGYAALSVQTVDSYGSVPPTTQDEDIEAVRVAWTAQTNLALPLYTPGGATNYVKVRYLESDSSQRSRAKKAGTYYYDQEASFEFVVNTVAPTKYDLCLATFTEGGGTFTFSKYLDHRISEITERITSINGTYHVNTQADFEAIIEIVAGSQYQFKDEVISVVFDYLSGGFQMPTNGYLQTNNCKFIEMKGGAFIDFNASTGYLEVNTDDCYLRNIDLQGNGGSGAIAQSYLLNAYRVTYDNCKCSNRLSSIDMAGFQGSGTALHNITSKYINCSTYALDSADKLYGFKDCCNLQNCLAYDLDSTSGTDDCWGFLTCTNMTNCNSFQLDGSATYGFSYCNQISSCKAEDIDSDTGTARGFNNCLQISACYALDVDGTSESIGFCSCQQISSCKAEDIDSSGGVASGFSGCYYGSSLFTNEAVNSENDWIDTVDANIANKVSTPSVWT
jgi:hypothetical protein